MRISSAALSSVLAIAGWAQAPGPIPPPVTNFLEIDVENYTVYAAAADSARTAADALDAPKVFSNTLGVGDIVRINGVPAKGTFTSRATIVNYKPAAAPGDTEADTTRAAAVDWIWDIQTTDGASVGTIIAIGMSAGPPPPGAPVAVARRDGGSLAITGGTGAYLGVRGQAGMSRMMAQERLAAAGDDPSRRRANAGGAYRYVLHVIPMSRPDFWRIPGPWINRPDGKVVSPTAPATPGDLLTAYLTGLGPVKALVDPGELFPRTPEAPVSLPLQVLVNNTPVQVTKATGFPEMYDTYEVRFRLPEDTPMGTASVRVLAGWIAGPEIRINVSRR